MVRDKFALRLTPEKRDQLYYIVGENSVRAATQVGFYPRATMAVRMD